MAMNGETLGNAIGTALYNAIPQDIKACMTAEARSQMCTALQNSWKTAANCIVAHIKANAQVTVAAGIAVQVTPSSGTGMTSGTGTGTIA